MMSGGSEVGHVRQTKPGVGPKYTKQFPIPQHAQRTVADWAEKMLKAGVIERCPQSLWNSLIFVVPKKDGTGRVVSYMREVNKRFEEIFPPKLLMPS